MPITTTSIHIEQVVKRDGTLTKFSLHKIADSIYKAAETVGGKDKTLAIEIAHDVVEKLNQKYTTTISAENIQDLVERTLIEKGHIKTAKAYILYQHKKNEERAKALQHYAQGGLHFSQEAIRILERRYLLKDMQGNLIENPEQMLRRVAKNIAQADQLYGVSDLSTIEDRFFTMMAQLRFLPNSPTLMNAGTKTQQLSSCFVLPVEDSMKGIFGTLLDAASIHQRGSGTGFSFSRLRPKGDPVERNLGVASGPVAFLGVYDAALDVIKQGGIRPGANMAVLRVDHPDILRFIECKRDKKSLKNFNISVAVTDNFMHAVEQDREYFVVNPKNQKYVGKLRARDVFSVIVQNAWKTGDPGLIFIDEINRKHPAKNLGEIETTNQCGEAPLLPYEGCVLGSLNLNKFLSDDHTSLNWDILRRTVHDAVHFLDNVIDMNNYPLPEIEDKTKRTRKFGLGIMGFADILIKLNIKYDSEKGLEFADTLFSFIKDVAYAKSQELAQLRGCCPGWEGSEHHKDGRTMRNITCLSISPTGTISILADASSGCEPLFAISYQKTVLGDSELVHLNKHFEQVAKEQRFYSVELMRKIARVGSISQFAEIPSEVRNIFVTAQDISPEWHVQMQATLQKHIDNSISKTINFPAIAAIKDVENAYLLAWNMKCKGITIYRDGSYEDQVMTIGE
ncbi:MAG TPA: adenosylcobalamin-dependent ribonucleoside-diphosphate reductase [Candidatus Nanoarchaeia archaeon]|nr:adenosylcobalamin-dependent ribonucleoside-diphosphate reductase [Candidatus Nanoarchaeia archaeon]